MVKQIGSKKLIIICISLIGLVTLGSILLVNFLNNAQNNIKEIEPVVCEIVVHDKKYLAIDEARLLDNEEYVSQDENVCVVSGNKVIGTGVGTTIVSDGCNEYEIEVTDMITVQYISEDKQSLPCGRYTVEENEYLDEVLASKIKEAGYHTRAGAVEAARFLLLQFPYHMEYFSENGRYYSDHTRLCEGEGRYYHEGLYLNLYKSEMFVEGSIVNGPAEWGCKIFSDPAGIYQINSLDCSGFVTWCLVNGGWDPGDLGAGITEYFDYDDIGPQHKITMESLDEVKVGDLFAEDGHISILIGIDDEQNYYIAESNLGIDIRVRVSTKQELIDSLFYAWIDMEEFYENTDGNLTNMWVTK